MGNYLNYFEKEIPKEENPSNLHDFFFPIYVRQYKKGSLSLEFHKKVPNSKKLKCFCFERDNSVANFLKFLYPNTNFEILNLFHFEVEEIYYNDYLDLYKKYFLLILKKEPLKNYENITLDVVSRSNFIYLESNNYKKFNIVYDVEINNLLKLKYKNFEIFISRFIQYDQLNVYYSNGLLNGVSDLIDFSNYFFNTTPKLHFIFEGIEEMIFKEFNPESSTTITPSKNQVFDQHGLLQLSQIILSKLSIIYQCQWTNKDQTNIEIRETKYGFFFYFYDQNKQDFINLKHFLKMYNLDDIKYLSLIDSNEISKLEIYLEIPFKVLNYECVFKNSNFSVKFTKSFYEIKFETISFFHSVNENLLSTLENSPTFNYIGRDCFIEILGPSRWIYLNHLIVQPRNGLLKFMFKGNIIVIQDIFSSQEHLFPHKSISKIPIFDIHFSFKE